MSAEREAFPDWADLAASREGWSIFECSGSVDGPWQICRIDEPDVGDPLESDDEAWRIVMSGNKQHHRLALDFIKSHNPQEFERMQAWWAQQAQPRADEQPMPERNLVQEMHARLMPRFESSDITRIGGLVMTKDEVMLALNQLNNVVFNAALGQMPGQLEKMAFQLLVNECGL